MEEGIFYHVYNRGNNCEKIFREKENYLFFLQRYKKYLLPHIDTYAYCLMPTHFHFLSCVKETTRNASKASPPGKPGYRKLTPLEKAYRDFFISYAKSFNKRFDRTGSLFQYKFKRKPVRDKKHLLRLVLYIHANPLQVGLCKSYEAWLFSS
ncbi:MAG: hypothetical protein MAG431_01161 [Chloroflexi bacterium]|nr:hypothetical protein [Chloroflexota bacterium]